MKENLKQIHVGKGLGTLTFGNTRQEVKAMLGDPSDVEKYSLSDDGGDSTEAWHYDDLDLSLSFDEENDYRLSSIAVSSEDYTLEGISLIGKQKEEVLAEVENHQWGAPEEEDEISEDNPDNSLVHIDKSSLSLWFEKGELTELQIGPFYKNDGILWPSSSGS